MIVLDYIADCLNLLFDVSVEAIKNQKYCTTFAAINLNKEVEYKGFIAKIPVCESNRKLTSKLTSAGDRKYKLINNAGSVTPLLIGAMRITRPGIRIVVLNDREEAAYFYNDVVAFADEKQIAFLPSSYRRMVKEEEKDNDSVLVRTEVLSNLSNGTIDTLITFPEALLRKW